MVITQGARTLGPSFYSMKMKMINDVVDYIFKISCSLKRRLLALSLLHCLVTSDLKLKLIDSLLHSDDVLFDAGLLGLKPCDLVLQACALGPLILVVALDFLLNAMELVGESFACVALLHGKHTLEGLFLRTQNLHFFLVGAELLLKGADRLVQAA